MQRNPIGEFTVIGEILTIILTWANSYYALYNEGLTNLRLLFFVQILGFFRIFGIDFDLAL